MLRFRRSFVLALAASAVGLLAQAAFASAPTVSSVSPAARQNSGSVTLTINGTGLDVVTSAVLTKTGQGEIAGTSLSSSSAEQMQATFNINDVAPGAWTVRVTNGSAESGTCAGCFLIAAESPTVSSASPNSRGQGATNQNVTITGTHLFPGATVAFSGAGVTVNTTTVNNTTSITVNLSIATDAPTGARDVTVTNTDNDAATCTGCFTINTSPTATTISPTNRGQGATNQAVTITGTGFLATPSVTFSGAGVTAGSIVRVNATTVTASVTVADDAATGQRTFTVVNPDGGPGVCTNCFTVNAKPAVTSTNPTNYGQGATAQPVVITGTNFDPTATAAFGTGVTVTGLTRDSATQLTATVSIATDAPAGAHTVTVTNSDGATPGTCSCFTVNAAPTASSTTPSTVGQGATSQSVTVAGTGFAATPTVAFSGAGITVNSVARDSEVQLTLNISIANGSTTGLRTLTITNPDKGIATCACFTVTASPALIASGVSPSSRGQGATGQTVVLTGANFGSDPTVSISGGGLTYTKTRDSATRITLSSFAVGASATTGARNVTITNADGGAVTCTGCFTVNAAPTASAITPTTGANNQTVTLTITGTGFDTTFPSAGSAILRKTGQSDIVGTGRSRASANQVSAQFNISGVAPGLWSVVIVNGDAGGPATCSNCFNATAGAPSLSAAGVSPNALGQGATSRNVTLTGTNFYPGATVSLVLVGSGTNGITVNSVSRTSATQLIANVTISSSATVAARSITVTNTDSQAASCLSCFNVHEAPTATAVTPNLKPNTGSFTLTITGTGFDNASGSAVLRKSGAPDIAGTAYQFVNSTTVKATFDLTTVAPGTWDMRVTNGDAGGPAICSSCFTIAAGADPTVTTVSPVSYGAGALTQDVTITGTNFFNGAVAAFSGLGISVNSTTRNSTTQIVANITIASDAATTARAVSVTNTDAGSATCAACFTVLTGPTVSEVSPTPRAAGASNQTITITGTGFLASPTLSMGDGITILDATREDATQITAHVSIPSDSTTGARDVVVTNTDKGRTVCSGCFTVTGAPTVSTVTPSALGQGATDEEVVVEGTGFVGTPTAMFSGTGVTVTDTVRDSATQLTLTVTVDALAAAGARDLTVTNPDQGSATKTGALTVHQAPTVTSVSPSSRGQGASDHVLTLTGTGFLADPDVGFSGAGITVTSAVRDSATQVTLHVDVAGDADTGLRDITLTNTGGATPAICDDCFMVTAKPTVTSADPADRGQGAQNQVITVIGTGFVATPTVTFSGDGITVDDVVRTDALHLSVTVDVASDAATTARDITVTNPDGATPAVCDDCFTVSAKPTATSVAPDTGSNDGPVLIVITGSGFNADGSTLLRRAGELDIPGTTYAANSATEAQAVFELTGAAPAKWDVLVSNGAGGEPAVCSECFTITAAAPTVTSASPAARARGAENQTITVTGTNFFGGATPSFSGSGITVNSSSVTDSTHLVANISIASDAPADARNVVVTNSDAQSASCNNCFTITDTGTVSLAYLTSKPLTGALVTATFSADSGPVNTSNFVLRETDTEPVAGTVACRNSVGASTSCSGSSVRSATFSSTSSLITNESYTARINPTGSTTALSGGAPVTTGSVTFRAGSKTLENSSAALTYMWDGVSTSSANGGSYQRARLQGQTATKTITGKKVTLYTVTGPEMGKADLYVGSTKCTINMYATSRRYNVAKSCSAPATGTYTFKVYVRGETGSTSGSGTFVAIDALKVDSGALETTPSLTYGWATRANSTASGGSYAADNVGGAWVRLSFRGTGIDWYTITGTNQGKVDVYIDGLKVRTIDNYATATNYNVKHSIRGLSDSVHTIRIVVTGTKRAAATGTTIRLDRFIVI